MKKAAFTVCALSCLAWATDVEAKLMATHHCDSLRCVEHRQLQNLRHARYVCHNGARYNKRWNCQAVRWLRREYNQTEQALHPVPAPSHSYYTGYRGLTSIRYAVAFCESGGDPFNKHNPVYRGKWQFDTSTWNAYAPAAYRGWDPADAPEWVQDQAALAVTYDAWPNC